MRTLHECGFHMQAMGEQKKNVDIFCYMNRDKGVNMTHRSMQFFFNHVHFNMKMTSQLIN